MFKYFCSFNAYFKNDNINSQNQLNTYIVFFRVFVFKIHIFANVFLKFIQMFLDYFDIFLIIQNDIGIFFQNLEYFVVLKVYIFFNFLQVFNSSRLFKYLRLLSKQLFVIFDPPMRVLKSAQMFGNFFENVLIPSRMNLQNLREDKLPLL